MNAGVLIKETLLADGVITGLVGSRVGPRPRVAREDCPCVTYWRTGDRGVYSHSGASGLRYPRYYVKAWATSYEVAQTLGLALREALDGAGMQVESTADEYEPDTGLHCYLATAVVAEAGG